MDVEFALEQLEKNKEAVEQEVHVPEFALASEVREFAPSMEVQAEEIKDVFLDIPELHYDEWKELSVDQRIAALSSFEEKIATIEMRDAMPVVHEATKPNVMGYYNGQKLVISDTLISSDSYAAYKEALDTLFHEGRHAYQYYNLDVTRTEQSSEMVEAWRVNLKELGYDPAKTSLFSNVGFYRYYTQPVEVDARLFAETVSRKIGL